MEQQQLQQKNTKKMKIKNIVLLCLFVLIIISHNKLSYSDYNKGSSIPFSEVTGSVTGSQLPSTITLSATSTTTIATSTDFQMKTELTFTTFTETYLQFLLHMNGTDTSVNFFDSSTNNIQGTASGNAQVDTAQSVFNESALFDGTGDFLTFTTSPYWVIGGAQERTIKLRVRFNAFNASSTNCLIGTGLSTEDFWMLQYNDTAGNLTFNFDPLGGGASNFSRPYVFGTGTWYAVALSYNPANTTWRMFVNGSQLGTGTIDGTGIGNYLASLRIGKVPYNTSGNLNGWVDELAIFSGTGSAILGTYTVETAPFNASYNRYKTQFYAPYQDYAMINYDSPGSRTTQASYIFNNGSITAHGYGSTTDMSSVGSSNVYSAESRDADLATNFIVKSKDAKGRNFREVITSALNKIGSMSVMSWNPVNHKDLYRLDAEAIAKEDYIQSKKSSWIKDNKHLYTSTLVEEGTGTVNIINTEKMNKDYNIYIEFEWASSPEQTKLIDTVEDNAESDLTIRNYGLRLEDPLTADELRKPGGIGLMDWAALNTKAIQELKAMLESATAEIQTLKAKINP